MDYANIITQFSQTDVGQQIVPQLIQSYMQYAQQNGISTPPLMSQNAQQNGISTPPLMSQNAQQISDEDMKNIHSIIKRGAPFSTEDIALLARASNAPELDDNADDSVIEAYADHLYNYIYNYKDEATEVDPSIDPNQDQIGIMAQDLEQVNPACIETLPNGVKTVNTGRLALMNAGAIADLARRLKALEERL